MDRPLKVKRNIFRARLKRLVLTGFTLIAIVFGIGMIPVGFIYFWSEKPDEGSLASSEGGNAEGSYQRLRHPRPGTARMAAFIGVNVVPMDSERVLIDQTVIIRDGQITEIGPAAKTKVPAGSLNIDGRGKYLIPGLADMHIHLTEYGDEVNLAILQLFVARGVTTVLNLRGSPLHLRLRERVARGEVLGPTIYTAGPFVNEPFVKTPEEVERAVVEQKRAGYDFIKMHGDLSREAYARLFVAARREGIRVIGHAPRNLGIEAMFEERQYGVVHAEEYLYDKNNSSKNFAELEPKITRIAQATAGAGTWLIPNLTAYKNIGLQVNDVEAVFNRPEMKYVPPRVSFYWSPSNNPYLRRFGKQSYEAFRARYVVLEKLVIGMRDAGVRMLAGTDALNPSIVPGFSTHDELLDLVAAGLTPYEAMKTATVNPAEFLGAGAEFGTVSVGKRADLVLVYGDPLKDVANTGRQAGVMIQGRWFAEADIRKMLDDLSASYAGRAIN